MRLVAPALAAALALGGGAFAMPSRPQRTVPCWERAGALDAGDAEGRRIVLDVVSVPPVDLGQPVAVQEGRWRYWLKAGLAVRVGNPPVDVSVPRAWRRRVAVTWGSRRGYFHTLRFASCRAESPVWLGYAGGFFLRGPSACVPLVFRVGGRSATVRFGIGSPCGTGG